eukprot:5336680-Pleurochrysis_carterae.AAC.6
MSWRIDNVMPPLSTVLKLKLLLDIVGKDGESEKQDNSSSSLSTLSRAFASQISCALLGVSEVQSSSR